jgi:hypothetical protein
MTNLRNNERSWQMANQFDPVAIVLSFVEIFKIQNSMWVKGFKLFAYLFSVLNSSPGNNKNCRCESRTQIVINTF